jgi:hypothetical protein
VREAIEVGRTTSIATIGKRGLVVADTFRSVALAPVSDRSGASTTT